MKIEEPKWRQVTIREAKKYLASGALVWWRPNSSVVSKLDPDSDPAWIMEVK